MDRQFFKIKSDHVFRLKHPNEQSNLKDFQVNIKDEHNGYNLPDYFYTEKIGDKYEEFLTRIPIVDLENYENGVGVYCEGLIKKEGYVTFMEPEEMFKEVNQEEVDKYFWELDKDKLKMDAIKFAHFAKSANEAKLHEESQQKRLIKR